MAAVSLRRDTECSAKHRSRAAPIGNGRVQRMATISAASTAGFLVLAFRVVRTIFTSRKPACRNSSQKATASFAPATHENQLAAPVRAVLSSGACRISSAPKTEPPGFRTRASSRKIWSRKGFRLKMPLTRT